MFFLSFYMVGVPCGGLREVVEVIQENEFIQNILLETERI